jgi:Skp family chaperone for outer membrane proteins
MRLRRAGIAALAALAASSAARAGESKKIGVVHVREILARYKKHEDLQRKRAERFQPRSEGLKLRQTELARRVAEIQKDLADSDEQDPRRIRAVKEIEMKELLLKLDYRQLRREMQTSADRITAHVLAEVGEACRRIGEAQGYYLILKRYGPDPDARDPRQQVDAFQLDPVLYCSPEADITSRVLDLLEDAYRQGIPLVPEPDEEEEPADPEGEN